MFVIKQDPRFKDAEDEDEYQAGRKNPILRDIKTCRLKGQLEVESSDSVKFEPPLYIQRYAAVSQILISWDFSTFGKHDSYVVSCMLYLWTY